MKTTIANHALANCQSIESVVVLVNDEFATDASSEMVAAAYAIDAWDKDYDFRGFIFVGHIDFRNDLNITSFLLLVYVKRNFYCMFFDCGYGFQWMPWNGTGSNGGSKVF